MKLHEFRLVPTGGGEGHEVLSGNEGHDFLEVGGSSGLIRGGTVNDLRNGGDGNDAMDGGQGVDQFIFDDFVAGGTDTILPYGVDWDASRVSGVENASGSGLQCYVEALHIIDAVVEGQAGASMSFNGQTILVQGVSAAELTLRTSRSSEEIGCGRL